MLKIKNWVLIFALMSIFLVGGCNKQSKHSQEYQQQYNYDSWQRDKTTGKWGYISDKGDLLISYQYDSITSMGSPEFYAVFMNKKWGAVNAVCSVIHEGQKYSCTALPKIN